MQHLLRFAMVGCFALALAGCDDGGSDDGGGAGTTGTAGGTGMAGAGTGGSGGGTTDGTPVTWDTTGWIDKTTNTFEIQGAWYSYDDCTDAMGLPCTMRDAGLTGPDMKTGWTIQADGKVCAKGTAAMVMDDMSYGKQWGFGIAFDLNNSGGMTPMVAAYDAQAKMIKGFSFDISGTAPATLRINVPTANPDNATYFREVPVTAAGATYKVEFTDMLNFKQGPWVAMQTPELVKTFNPATIYAVQFQVFTKLMATTPFDFCVSNFRVLE